MGTVVSIERFELHASNNGFTDEQRCAFIKLMQDHMYPTELRCVEEISLLRRDKDEVFGEYAVFMIHSQIGHWLENFSATVFFDSPNESELVCLTER